MSIIQTCVVIERYLKNGWRPTYELREEVQHRGPFAVAQSTKSGRWKVVNLTGDIIETELDEVQAVLMCIGIS